MGTEIFVEDAGEVFYQASDAVASFSEPVVGYKGFEADVNFVIDRPLAEDDNGSASTFRDESVVVNEFNRMTKNFLLLAAGPVRIAEQADRQAVL